MSHNYHVDVMKRSSYLLRHCGCGKYVIFCNDDKCYHCYLELRQKLFLETKQKRLQSEKYTDKNLYTLRCHICFEIMMKYDFNMIINEPFDINGDVCHTYICRHCMCSFLWKNDINAKKTYNLYCKFVNYVSRSKFEILFYEYDKKYNDFSNIRMQEVLNVIDNYKQFKRLVNIIDSQYNDDITEFYHQININLLKSIEYQHDDIEIHHVQLTLFFIIIL